MTEREKERERERERESVKEFFLKRRGGGEKMNNYSKLSVRRKTNFISSRRRLLWRRALHLNILSQNSIVFYTV